MNAFARRARSVAVAVALACSVVALAVPVTVDAAHASLPALASSTIKLSYVDHKTQLPSGTILKRGQQIDFTATIRPFVATVGGHVIWEVWGTRKGKFQRLILSESQADTGDPVRLGQAGFDVSFNQIGRYAVRAMAVATSQTAASPWTAMHYFNVK
jgi:hypothetical protein